MDTPTPIQVDLGRIAQDLQIRRVQVESVVGLLDEGNTVPFITRYRKERTGGLGEAAIREIQARVGRMRELAERKETIIKTIEAQGKLTEELRPAIRSADNPKRLEDLYLPFKPKKKSKGSEAREKGLEPLALAIWNREDSALDMPVAAGAHLNPEKDLESVEKVLDGVAQILAEGISEMATVRDAVRRVVWRTGKIVTNRAEIPDGEGLEYRDYFNYSEPCAHIPPHRVLAINRGDKEGPLKVRLEVPRPEVDAAALGQLSLEGHTHAEFLTKIALDAVERLLLPAMEKEVRRDLTEMAERHAVDVFARNLRRLLLQPPIPTQVVLAIDPGFRTGCKVAVLDGEGNLLDHCVIHPHTPQNHRYEAKMKLKDLVGKYTVGVVAIGNGTACRETEELVAEMIAEGTLFHERATAGGEQPQVLAVAAPAAGALEPGLAPELAPAPPAAEPAPEAAASGAAEPAVAPQTEPAEAVAAAQEPPAPPADAPPPAADVAADNHHAERSEPVLPPISGGAPDADPEPPPAEAQPVPPASAEAEAQTGGTATLAPASEPPPEGSASAPANGVTQAEPAAEAPQPPDAHAGNAGAPDQAETAPATPTADAPAAETPAVEAPAAEAPAAQADAGSVVRSPGTPLKPPPHAAGKGSDSPRGQHHGKPRPPRPRPAPPPPAPHPADSLLARLSYVIVNEAGASVYSTSTIGREEFPEFDSTLRSAISIGRRLQDPLSELVKIEPQNIGVGLYQHDVNPKQLKESLELVIESCVNFVGVDLNTASFSLLRHVSGLNELTARRMVEFRKDKGPLRSRAQLMEVEGISPESFRQAAGFVRVRDGDNPLDRTWAHPESYAVAEQVLARMGFAPDVILDPERLPALHEKLLEVDLPALARELQVGEPTLRDLFEALARPGHDPRDDMPKPIFKRGVLKLEDLAAGMELKGTVLNVVDFGAFVDIGLKDSGLVHISQLANRYIKSPHDTVSVGDVVTVWVMSVDQERKRVSLTMVKPGTERPRGGQGGGRRQHGEGREGEGGERRGGPRHGRREGQGGQPRDRAGAPPAPGGEAPHPAPSGETPPKRHDRPAQPPRSGEGGPPQGGGGGGQYQGRPSGPSQRGPGGRGRGGPRPGQGQGQGQQGRFERAQAPRPQPPPRKPAPPLPPLSKDALTGSVPLRTFGQLKQLWQARTEPAAEPQQQTPAPGEAPPPDHTEPPAPAAPPDAHSAAAPTPAPPSVPEPPPPPSHSESASPVPSHEPPPTPSEPSETPEPPPV
jgi:protein Tex